MIRSDRILLIALTIAVLPLVAGPGSATRATEFDPGALRVTGFTVRDRAPRIQAVEPGSIRRQPTVDRSGRMPWIVQFEEAPLALFEGGTPPGASQRFEATQPAARGEEKLDPRSPASREYLAFLAERQQQHLARIESALGRATKPRFNYRAAFNGAALELTEQEARSLTRIEGIRDVQPEFYRYPETDRGPTFIGANRVWDGSFADGPATLGEGVVVGIIDSGLNITDNHPSFAELGGDGFQVVNPLGAGVFRGWCDSADPNFDPALQCNGKVIGAYSFTQDATPDDENGHGSHVASTAAGNVVNGVSVPGTTAAVDVSGVAPHANLIIYEVCDDAFTGACPGTAILAALDQVVLDADVVDVVNFSIGGGSNDPWSDADAQGFLAVREAGVFVATSAGNSGPGAATVGSPADAPWLTSVANQTHDRVLVNASVTVTGPGTVPASLVDMAAIQGSGPAFGGVLTGGIDFDAGNATGCTGFAAGTFSGQVALIERGGCSFAVKVDNASAAGAVAVVVFNNQVGAGPIAMGGQESTTIPSVMVGNDDGFALRDWIAGTTGATVEIDPTFADAILLPEVGDVMATTSSRGPNPFSGDILKPDVSAPGSAIFAALGNNSSLGDDWGFLSGTSMASPHVAGSAALVRDLHPGWSPAAVHSALVMRAENAETIVKEDGVTASDPFDRGGGRVSPPGAAGALLVMNENRANFDAADPGIGGDPTALNLPSLAKGECFLNCSWTRTFTMVDDGMLVDGTPLSSTWSIDFDVPAGAVFSATPSSFTLNAGESQTVTFDADMTAAAGNEWAFGFANLNLDSFTVDPGTGVETRTGPGQYQRMPVSVFNFAGTLPDPAQIETRRDAGSRLFTDLRSLPIVDLQIESTGLVRAGESAPELAQDPTVDPFDDLSQVFFTVVTVPEGARRLIAEIESAESPDADLYVVNLATSQVVCAPQLLGSVERCDLPLPAAADYLILVQNFTGSAAQPDTIRLYNAVVPAASGAAASLGAEGPAGSVAGGDPWDLRILFDLDSGNQPGRWYGELVLGSDVGQSGDLGSIPVAVHRQADDVVKVADVASAALGETIEYSIFVDTNLTGETRSYSIADQVPSGLSIVPGSISTSLGTASISGSTIFWDFNLAPPGFDYQMTTQAETAACGTGFGTGGYVNLQDFAISPADLGTPPDQPIDTTVFTAFGTGLPIDLYGVPHTGIGITDDGFLVGDPATNYGGSPWIPQAIPDAVLPNNLIAALWQDMEIVNDPANFKGLSLATSGAEVVIIEYDDLQPFAGDGSVTWDFEVILRRTADDTPGVFEIVLAYANLSPLAASLTVGVENATGETGTALVNNAIPNGAIDNATVVCFDRVATAATATLTYQAEVVGSPGPNSIYFINEASHSTDEIGGTTAVSDSRVLFNDPDRLFLDSFEAQP